MSQNSDNFIAAVATFRSVAERMPADAWDNQSCCTEWSAREAAGHASWVLQNIAAGVGGTEPPARRPEAEVAGADPSATMLSSAAAATSALDGADLSTPIPTPFGEMPIDNFLGVIYVDTLAHAWDIADAGAIAHGISPELATSARASLEPIADTLRSAGGMAGAQPEPDNDPVGAFIAFAGRVSVNA